ncbi:hypothetical protein [Nonomuraea sp. NPDC023979]|uniref:hypothetical protein n=1 Tax=Nonomuraea sp. NPDC023979 TaxID=3154796 RepID=UPI0033DE7B4D
MSETPARLPRGARRNAPPGHVEREMMRLFRSRERNGVPQWDLPHLFVPLRWDGSRMSAGPAHQIEVTTRPNAYPDLLAGLASDDAHEQARLAREGEEPTLYGYMLLQEMYSVEHSPATATPLEERRWKRDSAERRYHERPDARESCMVLAADIDGRYWQAIRFRHTPKQVRRMFWQSVDSPCISKSREHRGARFPGGISTMTMMRIAKALAMVLYGDQVRAPADAEVVSLRG